MEQLLTTKLFIPSTRPELVSRPRLIERLNKGLERKMSLISAPAGFGKTTLISEWVTQLDIDTTSSNQLDQKVAWLSLDENDNDQVRFLRYIIAALNQTNGTELVVGKRALNMLQSPQPPQLATILTTLINEISTIPTRMILILDDYHLIEAQPIHEALRFLIKNIPPRMHLVIATREDPNLPLSRLRARDQLTELRARDLRFTTQEAAEFLNQVMDLNLSEADIASLENRTEGWIAGLQLAAISLRGKADATQQIMAFSGSHRLVLDYLIEEVLEQQPERVQTFLLQTAILNRLSGSLCDAVRFGSPRTNIKQDQSQEILEMLDRGNLFIIPLDNERHWYRYHHLFADLLQQRLQQITTSSIGDEGMNIAVLHTRASKWYESNGLEIEAFQHAAAANDIERAERLIEGDGVPLAFRGAVTPVLRWLESLPAAVLDARPSLWVTYAMSLLATGQTAGVEERLQSAEAALQGIELDDKARDLIGRIADTRGTLAVGPRQVDTLLFQSRRALEYLHPDNLTYRTSAAWKLGVAYEFQGDRAAARQAFTEALSISQESGNLYTHILASTGLGNIQLAENQLYEAAETFRSVLQQVCDLPIPVGCHVHLSLGKIYYQWNDLDAAQYHGQISLQQAEQFKHQNDIFVACQVFLARLKLSQGDVNGARAMLAQADRSARQDNFVDQLHEVVALQVLCLLHLGDLEAAASLAGQYELPISHTRVLMAQGDTFNALAILAALRREADAKHWQDEQLQLMVLQALTLFVHGDTHHAVGLLREALSLAEPNGFIGIFVDEGQSMARLLREALSQGISPDYLRRISMAFLDRTSKDPDISKGTAPQSSEWFEPLSDREIEVLQLIAAGLTNPEIAARLYLSLNTIKVHSRNIYSKLGVNNRTQAVAQARVLGIITST